MTPLRAALTFRALGSYLPGSALANALFLTALTISTDRVMPQPGERA